MAGKAKPLAIQLSELEERVTKLEALQKGAAGRLVASPVTENGTHQYCALRPVPERALAPDLTPGRARMIEQVGKKWVNGTTLRYWFFDSGTWNTNSETEKNLVREGFETWKEVGIGIKFKEVETMSEAEVRIGFLRGDGSWSYIGRDIISIPKQGERTMNFGWDLTADPRGVDVPVHEIGHTLGACPRNK